MLKYRKPCRALGAPRKLLRFRESVEVTLALEDGERSSRRADAAIIDFIGRE